MADENIENPEEKQPIEGSDDLFSKMSELQPLRVDESEDEELDKGEDGDGQEPLEERMESGRKLTDLQVADRRLNPDLGHKHLNVIMMSRVFPDNYTPLFRILVKDLIKNSKLSVAEAIAYVNTAVSIGIDGEGRIDEITIARGHIAEAEEEKTKSIT